MRSSAEQIRSLAVERVEQRIARVLLKLGASAGADLPEGRVIEMPLTRQDVADMTGTTIEFAHIYDLETGYDYGHVEVSANGGSTWASADPVDAFTQITAAGNVAKQFRCKSNVYRIVYAIGGTTPSFTFSVREYDLGA